MTLALGAALVPTLAYAASFALADGDVGAGSAPVAVCDTSFTIAYTTSSGNVTAVTVGDVADPACEGGQLSLTVLDSGGVGIGSGGPVAITADGDTSPNSVVVPIAPNPAAETVANTILSISGP